MAKNEKNNSRDNDLCRKIYRGKSDSLFDITKRRHTWTLNSNFYAFQLHQLERFVDDLLSNDEIPFVPILGSSGHKEYAPSHLACSYFTQVPVFIDVANRLSPKYGYSERIETFIACCHSLGLMDEPLGWWDIYSSPNKTYPHKGGDFRRRIIQSAGKRDTKLLENQQYPNKI